MYKPQMLEDSSVHPSYRKADLLVLQFPPGIRKIVRYLIDQGIDVRPYVNLKIKPTKYNGLVRYSGYSGGDGRIRMFDSLGMILSSLSAGSVSK